MYIHVHLCTPNMQAASSQLLPHSWWQTALTYLRVAVLAFLGCADEEDVGVVGQQNGVLRLVPDGVLHDLGRLADRKLRPLALAGAAALDAQRLRAARVQHLATRHLSSYVISTRVHCTACGASLPSTYNVHVHKHELFSCKYHPHVS